MRRITRSTLAVFAVSILASATIASQAPERPQDPTQSMKGAVIKGRAPVSEEILRVKLPRPAEADLANGVHLIVLEDHRTPTVTAQIQLRGAGGYYDPPDLPGLAQMTASMMQEGTSSRTAPQIAEELERMAASVSVGTSMTSQTAVVSASSLTQSFDRVLAMAIDILLNPSFPQEEFDRYKTRQRAGLIQQRSSPGFLANEIYSKVVFGVHPASRVSTNTDTLAKVTRDHLIQYHKLHYVPDHAVIAVSGDISMADVRKKLEAALGGWTKTGAATPSVMQPDLTAGGKVYMVDRKGSVQTNLIVGALAIDRLSPDYDAVAVMNDVVGGGPTGRLFMNLREDKGYTYGAYSSFSALRYRGQWRASTEVRTDVTGPALKELMGELARIRTGPVPEKEFKDKKRSMIASFALSLESPAAILSNHILRFIYGLPIDYWDKYPERIMAVTNEQVLAAAKKYLDPARLHIVAVGDADKIRAELGGFGPIEAYDTEGRKIGS